MADPRYKPIFRARAFPNPNAGNDLVITPDTAGTWLVRSIALTFVTDATVGTRSVILAADNGSTTWFRSAPGATQAATLTRLYGGFSGSAGAPAQGSVVPFALPTDGLWLPQGHRLVTAVENIFAGDQISAVTLFYIEFPSGPSLTMWPMPPTLTEEAS